MQCVSTQLLLSSSFKDLKALILHKDSKLMSPIILFLRELGVKFDGVVLGRASQKINN